MFKNVAAKFVVFAFDATTNQPKTGDAANITAYVSKDYGTVTVLADTSATEMDATNAKGYYLFDAAQGETNGDVLMVSAKSATASIMVIGAPAVIYTRPTTGWLAPTTAARTLTVDASGRALSDVDTIKTNPVVNGGTITFPTTATLASTTNITAGTITTATNLTNAPTAGDLTATMKTSVTTAATAATPIAASVTGAVGSVTGNVGGNVIGSVASVTAGVTLAASAVQAIWDALTSALTTVGSIGKLLVTDIDAAISSRAATGAAMTLTAGERTAIADAMLDEAAGIETGVTVRQGLRGVVAALLGKLSGAAGTSILIRDTGDTKNRVSATVDSSGNRSAVTLDLT